MAATGIHSRPPPPRLSATAQGLRAARANLLPGLVLSVVAALVVLTYYFFSPAAAIFARIAALKTEYGVLFSLLSTSLFAGVLPFFFQALQRGHHRRSPWRHLPFVAAFWAYKGVEVDFFYRLQSFLFGDNPQALTVIAKVFVDQFVYTAFWGLPVAVVVYLWKDSGFDFDRTRTRLGPSWYRKRVLPIWISNCAVWLPAISCIYLMPMPLQVPLFNLVACFWVLILMIMTSDPEPQGTEELGLAEGAPAK